MVGPSYAQNMRSLDEYYQRIDSGRLAVFRGVELTEDDKIRRDVITRLICHFVLDYDKVEKAWGIDFTEFFKLELERLRPMADDELLEMDAKRIRVKPKGRLLIRNICMQFDAYLKSSQSTASFSKVI
jgi:oxygen-independent coproporphyrinogen-3 oxidase